MLTQKETFIMLYVSYPPTGSLDENPTALPTSSFLLPTSKRQHPTLLNSQFSIFNFPALFNSQFSISILCQTASRAALRARAVVLQKNRAASGTPDKRYIRVTYHLKLFRPAIRAFFNRVGYYKPMGAIRACQFIHSFSYRTSLLYMRISHKSTTLLEFLINYWYGKKRRV
jgi:hypothetical protein